MPSARTASPPRPEVVPSQPLRCAIYTRQSSEEGLQQPFNSLHAQRESAEAFILSQRHLQWSALADAYDDGGIRAGIWNDPRYRNCWRRSRPAASTA